MKKRAMVFPYDEDFAPAVRHRDTFLNYDIKSLVSPKGWGLSGKDGGAADRGPSVGIAVEDSFEAALEAVDAVLILESRRNPDYQKTVFQKACIAADRGKEILYLSKLSSEQQALLIQKCQAASGHFQYCWDDKSLDSSEERPALLEELPVPLIYITSLTDHLGKFEMELGLFDQLQKSGYKVSLVGTRQYSSFLGLHPYPPFMFDSSITPEEKIYYLNRYLYGIWEQENPDLILMGIPGYITPFNRRFPGNFAIQAYMASMAATPDYIVLNIPMMEYNEELLQYLKNSLQNRFNYLVACFAVANSKINFEKMEESAELAFITNDYQRVTDLIRDTESDTTVYNLYLQQAEMATALIDLLAQYGSRQEIHLGGRISW